MAVPDVSEGRGVPIGLLDSEKGRTMCHIKGVSFPSSLTTTGPTLQCALLHYLNVIIISIVCLAAFVDCYSPPGGVRRADGREWGVALGRR
jgi:hypothetical protein